MLLAKNNFLFRQSYWVRCGIACTRRRYFAAKERHYNWLTLVFVVGLRDNFCRGDDTVIRLGLLLRTTLVALDTVLRSEVSLVYWTIVLDQLVVADFIWAVII